MHCRSVSDNPDSGKRERSSAAPSAGTAPPRTRIPLPDPSVPPQCLGVSPAGGGPRRLIIQEKNRGQTVLLAGNPGFEELQRSNTAKSVAAFCRKRSMCRCRSQRSHLLRASNDPYKSAQLPFQGLLYPEIEAIFGSPSRPFTSRFAPPGGLPEKPKKRILRTRTRESRATQLDLTDRGDGHEQTRC